MSEPPDQVTHDAGAFIADRIARRYGHPSRVAYLYLFHVMAGADFQAIPPQADQIITVWYDEGDGLQLSDPAIAIAHCTATADRLRLIREAGTRSGSGDSDSRRRLMARQVVFSIVPPTADLPPDSPVIVDLYSRAIAFTPKSDRRVTEIWKPFEGGWYSAYKPPPE